MKTVKFFKIRPKMDYPVGANIMRNLPIILEMAELLKKAFPTERIHLWCRGSSGAIIAGIIATNFKKVVICHIKKPGESSHSEGLPKTVKDAVHIIVDDFIGMGATVEEIHLAFKKHTRGKEIDCLCITGKFYINNIHFVPRVIIAKGIHNFNTHDMVNENCEFDASESGHIIRVRNTD